MHTPPAIRTESIYATLLAGAGFGVISFLPAPVIWAHAPLLALFSALLLILSRSGNGAGGQRPLFSLKLDWPLVGFLLSLALAVVKSEDLSRAWNSAGYIFLLFPLFFYLGKSHYANLRSARACLVSICTCSVLVAIAGLIELWLGENFIYERLLHSPFYRSSVLEQSRPVSTLWNTAFLGTYLVGCLPFILALWQSAESRFIRRAAILSACVLAAVACYTRSRGVFLALGAQSFFLAWCYFRVKGVVAVLAVLTSLILAASQSSNYRISRFGYKGLIGSSDSVISAFRLQRVKMALGAAQEQPLFGIGVRHFPPRFDKYCQWRGCERTNPQLRILDNMYLTLLAETGVAGLAGFLLLASLSALRLLRGCTGLRAGEAWRLRVAAMATLLALLVNMGAYDMLYAPNPFLLFALCCGFAASPLAHPGFEQGTPSASSKRRHYFCGRRSRANSTMRSSSSG